MTLAKQETEIMDLPTQLTPSEIIAEAVEWAKTLMDIVEQRNIAVDIQGKKYLPVEAWQIIGAFAGIRTDTEWMKAERDTEDNIIGWEAKVNLLKDGGIVGSGIMSCGYMDFPCRGRTGDDRIRPAKSAAQTWAASKAYRMNYSWVAVLAGYQPTPAEEMPREEHPTAQKAPTKTLSKTPPKQGAQCPDHKVPFFERTRKDGSKFYSHKQGGSWCNADKVIQNTQPTLNGEVIDVQTG
jgi:hypothetical protein